MYFNQLFYPTHPLCTKPISSRGVISPGGASMEALCNKYGILKLYNLTAVHRGARSHRGGLLSRLWINLRWIWNLHHHLKARDTTQGEECAEGAASLFGGFCSAPRKVRKLCFWPTSISRGRRSEVGGGVLLGVPGFIGMILHEFLQAPTLFVMCETVSTLPAHRRVRSSRVCESSSISFILEVVGWGGNFEEVGSEEEQFLARLMANKWGSNLDNRHLSPLFYSLDWRGLRSFDLRVGANYFLLEGIRRLLLFWLECTRTRRNGGENLLEIVSGRFWPGDYWDRVHVGTPVKR